MGDNYTTIEIDIGESIDNMVALLYEYNTRGEKVCVNFNDHTFYSDTVTLNAAYRELTGMTKDEYMAFHENERKRVEP